jgi:hypothetical protein
VARVILAVPFSMRRASLRVGSWILILPSRGKVTCLRPGSTLIVPVVKVNFRAAVRLDLNRGKPMRGPMRVPSRDDAQLPSALARDWQPEEYASLEFSSHQAVPSSRTATACLRRFHSRLNDGIDQPRDGVRSASPIP